ncbi:hypothetical protein [Asanoa sp. NPDC050611]|uniref:hypothetical protein n=1 Tax=Asanoa sp. NPDC050611 TaxID=3157098 RepID=UPI0033CEA1D2
MADVGKSARPSALRNVVAAAGVGTVLPFVALGAGAGLSDSPALDWICPTGGLECIPPVLFFGVAVAAAAGWPLLRLAGVRPAWAVAALGSILSVALVTIVLASRASGLLPFLVFAACAVSYATAAHVVAKLSRS